MCNGKAKVREVIIGATGTFSESLRQCLSNIPGKHESKERQKKKKKTTERANKKKKEKKKKKKKNSRIGTAHKQRKVLT